MERSQDRLVHDAPDERPPLPLPNLPPEAPPPRKWFRPFRAVTYPVRAVYHSFPMDQVAANGRLIGQLWSDLRSGPPVRGPDVCVTDGRIDLYATAEKWQASIPAIEALITVRRRQSALHAYCAFGLGCAFLLAWFVRLVGMEWSNQRIVTAFLFAPFCCLFFLIAFRLAHINWQLRTGQIGSPADYLKSPASFLPTMR